MTKVQDYAIERMYTTTDHRMAFGRGCEFKLVTAKALERRNQIVFCEQVDEHTAIYELSKRVIYWMNKHQILERSADFYERCRKDAAFSEIMLDKLRDVESSFATEEYMTLYIWISNAYRDLDHTILTDDFLNMIDYESEYDTSTD